MWLSLFAYMIQLGNKLGLVKTESESADGRAYQKAHQALLWLRSHLVGCELERVEETRVCFQQGGHRNEIHLEGTRLALGQPQSTGRTASVHMFEFKELDSVELGPEGFVRFEYRESGLDVTVQAGDDSLGRSGRYQSRIRFVVPLRND